MSKDEQLIAELRRGDKEALREIYLEYKDTLLTVAFSLLHDRLAAEDVLHDVFVSFAASAGTLKIRTSLRKYLITCIVNRVRDRFRRKRPTLVGLDDAAPLSSGYAGPDCSAIMDEEVGRLSGALAELPPEQRETIVLHLNVGLKFRDIAEMQKISISTVQGRYRYGLDKLRKILTEKQGNESRRRKY